MIGRIYTSGAVSGLARYLDTPKAREPFNIGHHDGRIVAVRPWALGLEATLNSDWVETGDQCRHVFRRSIAALRAISRTRPDLKHRVAHITLSADPDRSRARGQIQTRRDYLHVFRAVAAATGLSERCGVLVLHNDGHSRARRNGADPLEHLHALIVLVDPDTGRSVPLHAIRRRVGDACRIATANEIPIQTYVPPRPNLQPLLHQPKKASQRTPRSRGRSWEIDL